MAEADLNIVLKLMDEASGQLKTVLGQAGDQAKKVNNESQKATKSIADGMRDAGKQLRQFRQAALGVTVTIGFIAVMTKQWAEHNEQTRTAYNGLGLAIKEISALIGSVFAPAIISLADLINTSLQGIKNLFSIIQSGYTALFKSITYAIQYSVSFFSAITNGSNIMQAHKIATQQATFAMDELSKKFTSAFKDNLPYAEAAKVKLDEYAQTQQNLDLLFRAGQMSSQEYFNSIITAQGRVIEQNQMIADQSRAYISLAQEVSNSQLMSFESQLQGQMGLFDTYKQMYMQGHADMYAFANMLATQFHTNMSSALTSIILGEKKASEAFKEFGKSMVNAIVDYMVQQAVAFAVSKIMQGLILATTGALATSLAAMWAPAAALASLATLGSNAIPAQAGMMSTAATAYAIAATGSGAGGGFAEGTDSVPAMLTPGEMIFPRTMADAIRSGDITVSGRNGSGKQTINNISVTVNYPTIREDSDIEKIADAVSKRIALEAERL